MRKQKERTDKIQRVGRKTVDKDIPEKKSAEETQHQSEERYRITMMSVGDGVIATDTEGRVELLNPAAEALTGWRQEEARGKPLEEVFRIINEETRQTVENPVRRTMREGLVVGLANHSVLIAKDGSEHPIADSGAPIRNANGEITGVVLVFRDQTQERAAHRALAESERKFRDTVRFLDEGYYSCTIEGHVLDHNMAFNRILGFDLAQNLKGAKLPDFWQNPDDRREYLNELMARGSIRNYLINAKKTNDEKIVVMANSHLVKDEKDRLVRIEGTFTDFTERKRAEEALKESERRFRALFDNTPDGIVLANPENKKFIMGNETFYQMLGYNSDEIQNLGVMDIHPAEEVNHSADQFEKLLRKEIAVAENIPVKRKEGSIFFADIRAFLVSLAGKTYLTGIFRDITERRREEKALQESEERFRRVSAMTSEIAYSCSTKEDGRFSIEWMTGAVARITGYSSEEIKAQGCWRFLVVEEDLGLFEENVIGLAPDSKGSCVLRIRHKNGGIVWIASFAECVSKTQTPGRLLLFGGLADITEHKRAEEELRKSEERFKLVFEYAPDAYYINDLKGNFIDGNKAAEKTTGYNREELIGGSFLKLNLLSLDQLPKAAKLLANNAIGRPTGPDEFILKRKAGDKVPVEISTHPVKFENKTMVLGIARDITERMRTEEARRQAEENFRRSIDESPLGIRIVSAEGETLYTNRAILDIYGYKDIEELRSTPVKKRYTPASYIEFQLRKKKRMNGEHYPSEYEINIIRKTGEIRHLQVFRKEILWDGQKQFQAIYQDITERKKAEEKLRETLGGVIQVLSSTTEKRDPYTAGHQKRVADLARAIGQEMGLAAERVEGLRLAGTIHDIGKVSIPSEILSKPARLTKIEYEMIKSHPQVGHDILQDIDFSWPIAEMILQHHERMDGSGYPNRLKGENILLEARILAVSDVVEAMASHRPYRPALGIELALEEIEKNKGVLYDPDVVSACLTLFREKGFEFK